MESRKTAAQAWIDGRRMALKDGGAGVEAEWISMGGERVQLAAVTNEGELLTVWRGKDLLATCSADYRKRTKEISYYPSGGGDSYYKFKIKDGALSRAEFHFIGWSGMWGESDCAGWLLPGRLVDDVDRLFHARLPSRSRKW